MIKRFTRGFTLIELLVVIAIIGILSSVVLASLNSARGKGANTAVKSDLLSITAQAEIVYDNAPGSFDNVCGDTIVTNALNNASTVATGGTVGDVCNDAVGAWAASSPLRISETAGAYWCVDSTGASRGIAAALTTQTACPAS